MNPDDERPADAADSGAPAGPASSAETGPDLSSQLLAQMRAAGSRSRSTSGRRPKRSGRGRAGQGAGGYSAAGPDDRDPKPISNAVD
ncbi:MAG TPA: hypothetical protein VFX15_12250, partial [Actinomycetes bacterium]|nr:hypothetical protein [Actinomycetes bacterium]